MRPTRASSRCRSIRGKARGASEIDAAIRDVFDDYPNQLVEIYSVLGERIGETLSGESAPFSISVIGSDLDADDLRRRADRRRAAAPARQRQRPPDGSAARGGTARGTACPSSWPSTACRRRMCCRRSMRLITAARRPNSTRRIAACRWWCASRTPARIRCALGALLLRGRDGALTPLSAVARIRHGAGAQSHRSPGRAAPPDRGRIAQGRRSGRVCRSGAPGDRGQGAAAGRSVPALRRSGRGAGCRHGTNCCCTRPPPSCSSCYCWPWHSATPRHVLLVLLSLPSTLIGGVAAVTLTGGTLTLGAMVGFVALVRHGRAQHDLAGVALRPSGAGGGSALESGNRRARRRGAADAGAAHRIAHRAWRCCPVALQLHQPGHEIEGPMAVVILGGLVSSTLVSLLLIPPLAAQWLRPDKLLNKD